MLPNWVHGLFTLFNANSGTFGSPKYFLQERKVWREKGEKILYLRFKTCYFCLQECLESIIWLPFHSSVKVSLKVIIGYNQTIISVYD